MKFIALIVAHAFLITDIAYALPSKDKISEIYQESKAALRKTLMWAQEKSGVTVDDAKPEFICITAAMAVRVFLSRDLPVENISSLFDPKLLNGLKGNIVIKKNEEEIYCINYQDQYIGVTKEGKFIESKADVFNQAKVIAAEIKPADVFSGANVKKDVKKLFDADGPGREYQSLSDEVVDRLYGLHHGLMAAISEKLKNKSEKDRYALTMRELRRFISVFADYYDSFKRRGFGFEAARKIAFELSAQNVYFDMFPEGIIGPGRQYLEPNTPGDINSIPAVHDTYSKLIRGIDAGEPVLFIRNESGDSSVQTAIDAYVRVKNAEVFSINCHPFYEDMQLIGAFLPSEIQWEKAKNIVDRATAEELKLAVIKLLPQKIDIAEDILNDYVKEIEIVKSYHKGLVAALARQLDKDFREQEIMPYQKGILLEAIEAAKNDQGKEHLLIFNNIEALRPKVRALLNHVLLFKEIEVAGLDMKYIVPENLHIVATMHKEMDLADVAFYDRFLRKDVKDLSVAELLRLEVLPNELSRKIEKLWNDLMKDKFIVNDRQVRFTQKDLSDFIKYLKGAYRDECGRRGLSDAEAHNDVWNEVFEKELIYFLLIRNGIKQENINSENSLVKLAKEITGGKKIELPESIRFDPESRTITVYGVDLKVAEGIYNETELYRKTGLVLTRGALQMLGALVREYRYGGRVIILNGATNIGKTASARSFAKLINKPFYGEAINRDSRLENWAGEFSQDLYGGHSFNRDTEMMKILADGGVVALSELNTNIGDDLTAQLAWWLVPIAGKNKQMDLYKYSIRFGEREAKPLLVIDINPEDYAERGKLPAILRYNAAELQVDDAMSGEDAEKVLSMYLLDIEDNGEKQNCIKKLADFHIELGNMLKESRFKHFNYILGYRELGRAARYLMRRGLSPDRVNEAIDIYYFKRMPYQLKEVVRQHTNFESVLTDVQALEQSWLEDKRPALISADLNSTPWAQLDAMLKQRGVPEGKNSGQVEVLPVTGFTGYHEIIGGYSLRDKGRIKLGDAYRIIERCYSEINPVRACGLIFKITGIEMDPQAKWAEIREMLSEEDVLNIAAAIDSIELGKDWSSELEWRDGELIRIIKDAAADDKEHFLIFENYHRIKPGVAVMLNELLQEGEVFLPDGARVALNEKVHILAIGNQDADWQLSPAELSRWVILQFDRPQAPALEDYLRGTIEQEFKANSIDLDAGVKDHIFRAVFFAERAAKAAEETIKHHYEFNYRDMAHMIKTTAAFYSKSKMGMDEALRRAEALTYEIPLGKTKEETVTLEQFEELVKDNTRSETIKEKDGLLVPVKQLINVESAIINDIQQERRISILMGPPGAGKTDMGIDVADRLGLESFVFSAHERVNLETFIGDLRQTSEGNYELTAIPNEEGNFNHIKFLQFLTHGGIYVIDEGAIGKRAQELIAWLSPIVRGEKKIYIREHPVTQDGSERDVLKPLFVHDDFHIIITMNPPEDTVGREAIPSEIWRSSGRYWMNEEKDPGNLKLIVRNFYRNLYPDIDRAALDEILEFQIDFYLRLKEKIEEGRIGNANQDRHFLTLRDLKSSVLETIRVYNGKKTPEAFYEGVAMGLLAAFWRQFASKQEREILKETLNASLEYKKISLDIKKQIWRHLNKKRTFAEIMEWLPEGEFSDAVPRQSDYFYFNLDSERDTVEGVAQAIAMGKSGLLIYDSGSHPADAVARIAGAKNYELHQIDCFADMDFSDLVGGVSPEIGARGFKTAMGEITRHLMTKEQIKGLKERIHSGDKINRKIILINNLDILNEKVRVGLSNFLLNKYLDVETKEHKQERLYLPDNVHIVTTIWEGSKEKFSSAFYNRFTKNRVNAYSDTELEEIVGKEFGLSGFETGAILHLRRMIDIMEKEKKWSKADGYHFTVNDSLTLARYLALAKDEYESSQPKEKQLSYLIDTDNGDYRRTINRLLAREAIRVYRDALNDKQTGESKSDRDLFEDEFRSVFPNLDINELLRDDAVIFNEAGIPVNFAGVSVPAKVRPEDIPAKFHLYYGPTTARTLSNIVRAMKTYTIDNGKAFSSRVVFMTGESGIAKTTMGVNLSYLLGMGEPYVYSTHMGSKASDLTRDVIIDKEGIFQERIKKFLRLIEQGNKILILDEGNIRPEILYIVQAIARGDKEVVIPRPGEEGFKVRIGDNICVLITMNPESFVGRGRVSGFLLDNTAKLWVDSSYPESEEKEIIRSMLEATGKFSVEEMKRGEKEIAGQEGAKEEKIEAKTEDESRKEGLDLAKLKLEDKPLVKKQPGRFSFLKTKKFILTVGAVLMVAGFAAGIINDRLSGSQFEPSQETRQMLDDKRVPLAETPGDAGGRINQIPGQGAGLSTEPGYQRTEVYDLDEMPGTELYTVNQRKRVFYAENNGVYVVFKPDSVMEPAPEVLSEQIIDSDPAGKEKSLEVKMEIQGSEIPVVSPDGRGKVTDIKINGEAVLPENIAEIRQNALGGDATIKLYNDLSGDKVEYEVINYSDDLKIRLSDKARQYYLQIPSSENIVDYLEAKDIPISQYRNMDYKSKVGLIKKVLAEYIMYSSDERWQDYWAQSYDSFIKMALPERSGQWKTGMECTGINYLSALLARHLGIPSYTLSGEMDLNADGILAADEAHLTARFYNDQTMRWEGFEGTKYAKGGLKELLKKATLGTLIYSITHPLESLKDLADSGSTSDEIILIVIGILAEIVVVGGGFFLAVKCHEWASEMLCAREKKRLEKYLQDLTSQESGKDDLEHLRNIAGALIKVKNRDNERAICDDFTKEYFQQVDKLSKMASEPDRFESRRQELFRIVEGIYYAHKKKTLDDFYQKIYFLLFVQPGENFENQKKDLERYYFDLNRRLFDSIINARVRSVDELREFLRNQPLPARKREEREFERQVEIFSMLNGCPRALAHRYIDEFIEVFKTRYLDLTWGEDFDKNLFRELLKKPGNLDDCLKFAKEYLSEKGTGRTRHEWTKRVFDMATGPGQGILIEEISTKIIRTVFLFIPWAPELDWTPFLKVCLNSQPKLEDETLKILVNIKAHFSSINALGFKMDELSGRSVTGQTLLWQLTDSFEEKKMILEAILKKADTDDDQLLEAAEFFAEKNIDNEYLSQLQNMVIERLKGLPGPGFIKVINSVIALNIKQAENILIGFLRDEKFYQKPLSDYLGQHYYYFISENLDLLDMGITRYCLAYAWKKIWRDTKPLPKDILERFKQIDKELKIDAFLGKENVLSEESSQILSEILFILYDIGNLSSKDFQRLVDSYNNYQISQDKHRFSSDSWPLVDFQLKIKDRILSNSEISARYKELCLSAEMPDAFQDGRKIGAAQKELEAELKYLLNKRNGTEFELDKSGTQIDVMAYIKDISRRTGEIFKHPKDIFVPRKLAVGLTVDASNSMTRYERWIIESEERFLKIFQDEPVKHSLVNVTDKTDEIKGFDAVFSPDEYESMISKVRSGAYKGGEGIDICAVLENIIRKHELSGSQVRKLEFVVTDAVDIKGHIRRENGSVVISEKLRSLLDRADAEKIDIVWIGINTDLVKVLRKYWVIRASDGRDLRDRLIEAILKLSIMGIENEQLFSDGDLAGKSALRWKENSVSSLIDSDIGRKITGNSL